MKEPLDPPHEKQTEELELPCGAAALWIGTRPAEDKEPPGGGGIAAGIPVMVSIDSGIIPLPFPLPMEAAGLASSGEAGDNIGGDLSPAGGVFCRFRKPRKLRVFFFFSGTGMSKKAASPPGRKLSSLSGCGDGGAELLERPAATGTATAVGVEDFGRDDGAL